MISADIVTLIISADIITLISGDIIIVKEFISGDILTLMITGDILNLTISGDIDTQYLVHNKNHKAHQISVFSNIRLLLPPPVQKFFCSPFPQTFLM
jgi:hypothetical protein